MSSTRSLLALPAAVVLTGATAWLFTACSPEKQHYVPNAVDGETTPTMATTDVTTIISDSGYTRYKIVTPTWLMFEDAEEPFWRFPDGIALEQYDHEMNPESNVDCDSAVYFSRKRIWRLDGNVVMVNTERDSFLTQQLFWDQNSRKIYTDSFIHIVRTDRIIEGYGFESDQSMRWYNVTKPTAILPAEGFRSRPDTVQAADTAAADTAAAPVRRGTLRRNPPRTAPAPEATRAIDPATIQKQPGENKTPLKLRKTE